MSRKFGYQPQGRGEPLAPPKSGSNARRPSLISVSERRPRWIPVKERLPKEWWPVLGLIQYHDEKEPPAQQVLWYLGNGHWRETWRGDMIESNVTHWMPLPEPPKEKPTCEDCQRECQMMGLDMDACASYKPPEEE